jgi:hypothetical protein
MGRALVGALVLGLLMAASAHAAIDLQQIGTTQGGLESDGERYAAWAHGSTVSVLPDGESARSFDAPRRSDCESRSEFFFPLAAVGSGLLLTFECPVATSFSEPPRVVLRDIGTGQTLPVTPPRSPHLGSYFEPVILSVGRNWISARTGTNHFEGRAYWNWHDGDVVSGGDGQDRPAAAREAPDLDTSKLNQRLCSPLHRQLNNNDDPYGWSHKYADIQYRPPYALTRLHPLRLPQDPLALMRCGARRKTVLSRCKAGCYDEQLGSGHVVWREGGDLHVYVLRTRRHLREALPAPADETTVRVTGRRVLFEGPPTPDHQYAIYAGRLPSR